MTKPRRKKKYLLLQGWCGNYIVVERTFYDAKGMGRKRGDTAWKIVSQSDDESMLKTMGGLTDRFVGLYIHHEEED